MFSPTRGPLDSLIASVLLLVPISPHLFICTQLCWLGWPPFMLTVTCSCPSPFFRWSPFPTCLSPLSGTGWPSHLSLLICALCRSFMLIAICLLVSICPHSVVLAGPHAHCCLFVPFTTCSCSSPFVCWSPFLPTHLCLLGCGCPCYQLCLFGICSCSFTFGHARLCLSFVSLTNIRLVHT